MESFAQKPATVHALKTGTEPSFYQRNRVPILCAGSFAGGTVAVPLVKLIHRSVKALFSSFGKGILNGQSPALEVIGQITARPDNSL